MERNLLCVSSDCFENGPFGEEVAELDGVNLSAEKKKLNKVRIKPASYDVQTSDQLVAREYIW